MTDVEGEEHTHQSAVRHWLFSARRLGVLAPPAISVICVAMAAYFAHVASIAKPPPDLSQLAVSILKAPDAPDEMRDWARRVLSLQVDIPTTARMKPLSQ